MPRALEQILTELNSVYDPQRSVYNKQITALPGQQEAEMGGLESAKNDSFQQIVTGANRRGVAFGGIPLGEQAQYLGSSFLPAVANLKNRFQQQRFGLDEALAQLGISQRKDAQGIWNQEYEREESQRRWEQEQAAAREAAARAAASGGGGASYGFGGGGGGEPAGGGYGMAKKANGGFAFVDQYGNPISAASYAAATGVPFRQLLQTMANQGDAGARSALGFVGDDYGYDRSRIGNNAGLYNSLTWGTGRNALTSSNASPTGGVRIE